MALSSTELAADASEIFADLAQSATFRRRGKAPFTASGAVSDIMRGENAGEEGVIGEDALAITVKTADCTWTPAPGDTVTVDGEAYRVTRTQRVSGDACLTVTCETVQH